MTQEDTISEAVRLLQDLGLKEYESRCFMALTQLQRGTAKEIHEISAVPRTRVYDAIHVLESEGLVGVQHSSPQRYRAVGIDEATQILRRKYNERIETLETHLEDTQLHESADEDERLQEVWSLSGRGAIESRTHTLIDEAESEIALLVVDETLLSEALFDRLHGASERELSILLGGETDSITDRIQTELPAVRVFETGLDWLTAPGANHEVAISRLLLVDREKLLVASYYPNDGAREERAIFASGLENGIVVLLRRLVASGLTNGDDPGT